MKTIYISKINKKFAVKGKIIELEKGKEVDANFVKLFPVGKSRDNKFTKKEVAEKQDNQTSKK